MYIERCQCEKSLMNWAVPDLLQLLQAGWHRQATFRRVIESWPPASVPAHCTAPQFTRLTCQCTYFYLRQIPLSWMYLIYDASYWKLCNIALLMYDMTLLSYRHSYEELPMYSVPKRPKQAAYAPQGCATLAHLQAKSPKPWNTRTWVQGKHRIGGWRTN